MKGRRDVRCHGVTDPGSAGSNRMLSFGSLPGLLLLLLFHPVWDILYRHVPSLLTLSQFCIINSFRNILEVSYDCTFMVAIYCEETKVYTVYIHCCLKKYLMLKKDASILLKYYVKTEMCVCVCVCVCARVCVFSECIKGSYNAHFPQVDIIL